MEDEVNPMKNANITNVKWGEIYLCDLGSNKGSVQSGKRPVLVLQNNIGNNNGPTTVVATISSVLKKLNQPTHILLDTSCGLREDSIVMLEQIRTVDKEKELLEYIGEVRDEKTIYAIKQGVLTEFGLIKRPQPRRTGLILTLCPKCRAEFMNIPENILRRVDPLQVDNKDLWGSKLLCTCGHSFRKNRWHKNKGMPWSYGYQCYNQLNNGSASQRRKAGADDTGYCDQSMIADWKL